MRMIKFIALVVQIALLIGCSGTNKQKSPQQDLIVKEYSDSVVITESTKKEIPQGQGLVLGKVENCIGKDKVEKNMLSQIATYNSALLHGDKDNAVQYLYKDAIVYFRKYYKGLSDEEITDEFFKTISNSFSAQLNNLAEHGIEFSVVVSKLIRRVECNNDIFIVFAVNSNVCSESLFTHFDNDEQCIGISQNGGKNWSFLTINEDTPNILRIKYSEDIITAVMGY